MRVYGVTIKNEELDLTQDLSPQFLAIIKNRLQAAQYPDPLEPLDDLIVLPLPDDSGYIVGCKIVFPQREWISVEMVTPRPEWNLEIKIEGGATQHDIIYRKLDGKDQFGYYDLKGGEYFNVTHFRVIYKSLTH